MGLQTCLVTCVSFVNFWMNKSLNRLWPLCHCRFKIVLSGLSSGDHNPFRSRTKSYRLLVVTTELTGHTFWLGVPRTRRTQHSCSMSFSPGNRGELFNSSPKIQPTALQQPPKGGKLVNDKLDLITNSLSSNTLNCYLVWTSEKTGWWILTKYRASASTWHLKVVVNLLKNQDSLIVKHTRDPLLRHISAHRTEALELCTIWKQ